MRSLREAVRAHPRLATGLTRLQPIAVVAAIGAFLAVLPFSTCLVRLVAGVPCPACGLTRAGLAALHLDFAAAQRFHPLAIALLLLTAACSALAFALDDRAWRALMKYVTGGAGVALLAVWLLRFGGFFGGPVP